MAIFKAWRINTWPLTTEYHTECIGGALHLCWRKTVNLQRGRRILVDVNLHEACPCDGSCGRKTTVARRILRKAVDLSFGLRQSLKPRIHARRKKRQAP
ncbi:MAG: hypothetical protein ACOYUZ_04000 [Patescibacteria group bacterium]